jgi:hypothetical protein
MAKRKRFMPLYNVLELEAIETDDQVRLFQFIFSGGTIDETILSGVENGFLSLEMVLKRIQKFIDDKYSPPPEQKKLINYFDHDLAKSELSESLIKVSNSKNVLGINTKELDKFALLMFNLGRLVAVIDNQDLLFEGVHNVRKGLRAGETIKTKKNTAGVSRKTAYQNALREAEKQGYKSTLGGLRAFIKSLNGQRYQSGVNGCEEIWLENVIGEGDLFHDSQGQYKDSSVSRIKIGN